MNPFEEAALMEVNNVAKLFADPELTIADKGAYSLLMFGCDGEAKFADLMSLGADKAPDLSKALVRLRMHGYVTFKDEMWSAL